jgi:hypothetical protein
LVSFFFQGFFLGQEFFFLFALGEHFWCVF